MSKSFKGPLARAGGALAALIVSMTLATTLAHAAPNFKVEGSQFMLDGKPFQIRSGEMHYPRVPHELWRDLANQGEGFHLKGGRARRSAGDVDDSPAKRSR